MVDETYIAQVLAALFLLVGAIFLARSGFHKYLLSRYQSRFPDLEPGSVLFCQRWDIGLSKDSKTLFLMRRTDHKAIRVRAVYGYKRIDDRHIERGMAGRFREVWVSEVVLEYKGDQGKEEEPLTYGNSSSDSEKICRYLEQRGFRRLAMKANFRFRD